MSRERGFLLPCALALLVLVTAAGSAILSRSAAALGGARAALGAEAALLAADGGVETARVRLSRDPSWTGGDVRVGACDVTVAVVRRPGGWRVDAAARPGGVRVEAVLDAADGRLPRVHAWRSAP